MGKPRDSFAKRRAEFAAIRNEQVVFGGNYPYNYLYAKGDNTQPGAAMLTLGSGITVHGSQGGTLGGNYQYDSIINQGTFLGDTSGKTISLAGNWTSIGTIKTQNGGVVALTGTYDNTGQTLNFAAGTGPLTLSSSGTIKGGTVALIAATNIVFNGGTLDGVTLNGDLDLTPQSASLTVKNGLVLNGTATIGGTFANYDGYNVLSFAGTQTLSGSGTVLFGSAGYTGLILTQSNTTLTIGVGITVHGGSSRGLGARLGYNDWQGIGANTTILNQGIIDADVAGTSITIYPGTTGTLVNQGTVKATAGVLNLSANITTDTLGTVQAAGGALNLSGMLDNSGASFALNASTGSWLLSGTIKGGTVNETGGAKLIANGGTLDGVTLNGDLDLTPQSATLTVKNGLVLNGTATIGASSGNGFNYLNFTGTQSLTGNDSVVFGGASYTGLIVTQSNTTLTIGAGITVHGGSAGSYGARLGSNDYFGSGSNTTIINQGTIDADAAGKSLTIYASTTGTLVDQGILQVLNGGILSVGGPLSVNSPGLLKSSPTSTVIVSGNLVGTTQSAGLYSLQGTLNLNGSGTVGSPQLLEAMSNDFGSGSGFSNNFDYGSITIGGGNYVRLVDQSDNSTGAGAEAVYVNSLIVAAGATLDLNGLHLYAKAV